MGWQKLSSKPCLNLVRSAYTNKMPIKMSYEGTYSLIILNHKKSLKPGVVIKNEKTNLIASLTVICG